MQTRCERNRRRSSNSEQGGGRQPAGTRGQGGTDSTHPVRAIRRMRCVPPWLRTQIRKLKRRVQNRRLRARIPYGFTCRVGHVTWASRHQAMVSRCAFSFFFFINTPYRLYYILYIYYLPPVLQGMPVHTRHTPWLRHCVHI